MLKELVTGISLRFSGTRALANIVRVVSIPGPRRQHCQQAVVIAIIPLHGFSCRPLDVGQRPLPQQVTE